MSQFAPGKHFRKSITFAGLFAMFPDDGNRPRNGLYNRAGRTAYNAPFATARMSPEARIRRCRSNSRHLAPALSWRPGWTQSSALDEGFN